MLLVDLDRTVMQEMLNFVESQMAGFQKQLKVEQKLREKEESSAANSRKSLLTVQGTIEKTKTTFEEEKAALKKRVDNAESQLESVTEELTTLIRHIMNMCVAIFGEYKICHV